MKKVNNKGFSYVEMIVVLAILALMGGMITLSYGMINRNNVSRASETLESMANQARVNALTKGTSNGYLTIAKVDNYIYAAVGPQYTTAADIKANGEKVCSATNVRVEMWDLTSPSTKTLTGNTNVRFFYIQFEQVSGGIKSSEGYTGSVNITKQARFLRCVSKNGGKEAEFKILGYTGKVTHDKW